MGKTKYGSAVKCGGHRCDVDDPELQEAIKISKKDAEHVEPSLKKFKTSSICEVIDLCETTTNTTAVSADPLQKLGLSLQLTNADPGVWRASIYDRAGNCATWNDVIALLQTALGRSAFNYAISIVPFEAFTWEVPVLCLSSASCILHV
jgi:hypothetical protein